MAHPVARGRLFLTTSFWGLVVSLLPAATHTWDGTGTATAPTGGNWSDASNWSTAPVSGAGTILSFSSSSAYTSTNNLGEFTLTSLQVGTTLDIVTIAGDTLKFVKNGGTNPSISYQTSDATAGTNPKNVRLTIDSNVIIDSGASLNVTGTVRNGTVIINGLISGDGALSRATALNSGTLALTNANNTFTGGLRVGGGAVSLRASGAAGTGKIDLGTASVGAGLQFDNTNNQTHSNAIDLGVTGSSGNRPSITNNTTDLVLNGAITGTTTQTVSNSDLSPAPTTLRLTGTGTGTINGLISNTAGSLNVDKQGAGIWTLSAANTYDGTTTVSIGTLATSTTGSFGLGDVVIADATLSLGNSHSINDGASLFFSGESSIALSFTGTEIVSALILGTDLTGTGIANGLYSAPELNAFFGGATFQGDGLISVGAIPEPSAAALIAGGIVLTLVGTRRRRA